MDGQEIFFRVVLLGFSILGTIVTYYVVPYIKGMTTSQQREELVYWTQLAVKLAEQIYTDYGQGELKFDYVVEWLHKHGLVFTDAQIKILVDGIVAYFNRMGWDEFME